MWRMRLVLMVTVALLAVGKAAIADDRHGAFQGTLTLADDIEDPDEDSVFRVLEDFTFIDSSGKRWSVPSGAVVDGASIPRFFYTFIGGPWSGRYKRASVVHDHFCVTKSRNWREVHKAFYDAMIANKVPKWKARLMYYAVYRFGPRWTDTEKNLQICVDQIVSDRQIPVEDIVGTFCHTRKEVTARVTWTPTLDKRDVTQFIRKWKEKDISPRDLEKFADKQIENLIGSDSYLSQIGLVPPQTADHK